MAIYYEQDNLQLFLGDSLKLMKYIPSDSVDMVFADPPYNLSNGGFTCHAGKRVSVNKGGWDKSYGIDNDFNFHFQWLEEAKRVLKPNGTLWVSGTYHSIYVCGFALQKQGWHILNDIAWFKPNASPNLACRMFTASHETLLWAKKDKKSKHTFNYEAMKFGHFPQDIIKKEDKQMRSVWSISTTKSSEKIYGKHPTQKPELVLERVVLSSTNEGDIILDPFCGSGTTGVIASRYKRKFIGIEQEEEYLRELAIPRLRDTVQREIQLSTIK